MRMITTDGTGKLVALVLAAALPFGLAAQKPTPPAKAGASKAEVAKAKPTKTEVAEAAAAKAEAKQTEVEPPEAAAASQGDKLKPPTASAAEKKDGEAVASVAAKMPPAEAPAAPSPVAARPVRIAVYPAEIKLDDAVDRHRLVVVADYDDGTTREVTDQAEVSLVEPVATLGDDHVLAPQKDGKTQLVARFGNHEVKVPLTVANAAMRPPVSFANGVMTVITRSGCNSGTCHGSASGKNGFHLSLFAYDKAGDHRALTREMRGRRANPSDPHASLMLLKPTGGVPHKGGKRLEKGNANYDLIRQWIEGGARNDLDKAPKLSGIVMSPEKLVLAGSGHQQRLVVTALYDDGSDRDVTDLAILSSSNEMAATVDAHGVVEGAQKGETFVMARFGTFALVTQVLVLKEGEQFSWPADIEPFNYIDEVVFDKLRKLRVLPAGVCDDSTFVRRVYLDVLNILPTDEEAKRFLADKSADKRSKLVDELLQRPEFPDVWALEWAEILRVEPRRLYGKGMYAYNDYLRKSFRANKPLDQMARELVTSKGANFTSPEANYYLVETNPRQRAETTAQVFMGVRIQCAQCHNHPFERWTMDDYYGFSAFFTQVTSKGAEDARERVVYNRGVGEIRHPVSNAIAKPKFLGGEAPEIKKGEDRRDHLARWLTSPDNPFFATNIANRVFARFFGRGLVDPPDDVRVSNPPSHPELHRMLGRKLAAAGYDLRQLIRDLCASRTYQVAAHPDAPPANTYAGAPIRRMTAEQLLDALGQVTGVATKYSRLPLGARATQIANPAGSTFLRTFGRPRRESSCTCERRGEPTLSQVLHLINGSTTGRKIVDGKGRLKRQLAAKATDDAMLDELFLVAYSRTPSAEERKRILATIPKEPKKARETAWEDVFWAVLNSREFLFNH